MDHIDFDTEQSLFAATESSSTEQMAMSIPTQRRLIRKPLPDIPSSQANKLGGQSFVLGRTNGDRNHAVTLEESRQRAKKISLEEQKQLDWWPSSSKQRQCDRTTQDNEAGPSNLSQYYRRHLLRIIESSLDASGRPSQVLAKNIFDAIEECLATLATPEALKALHRSYSFLWRIEALVQSNDQADCSKTNKSGARWPRLGAWRGGSLSANPNGMNTDARRKKRDIALQLLGSAFWMTGVGVDGAISSLPMSLEGSKTPEEDALEVPLEKVAQKIIPGAAPQLFVKTSLPTVALQTETGSENKEVRPEEEPTQDRASVLTTRLAMQLKNAEKHARTSSDHIGKARQSEEETVLAICKVCFEIVKEAEDGEFYSKRRRRSGTVTLETDRREQNTSTVSNVSDHTIRGLERHDSKAKISWNANEFTGSPLFLNPLSSEAEGRDQLRKPKADSRVQLVGGTFVVESTEGDSEEEEDLLRNVLDLSLYAASAMMLESALLQNLQVESEMERESEDTVGISEEAKTMDSAPGEALASSSESVSLPEKQARWPTSIWGMIHYASSEHTTAPFKRDSPTSPTLKADPKKGGRRSNGYSGRFGKILGSLTGNAGKRPSTVEDVKQDADQIEEQQPSDNVEAEAEKPLEEERKEKESYLPPVAISPYYSDQAAEERIYYEKDDYMEHLLIQQSLSLNVLEGMDLSISIGKQQDEPPVQRAPLLSRKSYNDQESKVAGFPASVASSSKSTRSTSSSLQVDPQGQGKSSVTTSSIESSFVSDEKSRREVQFYQRAGSCRDVSLGQAVEEMVAKAIILNKQATQIRKAKDSTDAAEAKPDNPHTYRVAQYLHGHDRVTVMASVADSDSSASSVNNAADQEQARVDAAPTILDSDIPLLKEEDIKLENDGIMLWSADIKTGEETSVKLMSEATYLTSYGAFVQAVLSHPKLASEKHNIVRLFRLGSVTIKFQVQPIVVFDLLVEGPVVVPHQIDLKETESCKEEDKPVKGRSDDEKLLERTRLEIQNFYSSIKRHVSALEHNIVARDLDEKGKTIKRSTPSTLSSISSVEVDNDGSIDGSSTSPSIEESYASAGALKLLSRLKKTFRSSEFELYDGLKATEADSVNDVRITFQDRAKAARKRLCAWEEKHLTKKEVQRLEPLDYLEPEYFEDNNHVFPGSRHLVRLDQPLSMIAYTLSSREFHEEMHGREQKYTDVLNWRSSVMVPSTRSRLSSSKASVNTASTTTKSTAGDSKTELDPDEDDDFHTPELLQIRLKRKKRVKDAGILSLTLKRANSNLSSHSGKETDDTDDKTEKSHAVESSTDESHMTTPTASRIATSNFNTVSSTNDTFRAQVAPVASRGSLGSMFENTSTEPTTPSEEKFSMYQSETNTEDHTSAKETTREATTPTRLHDVSQRRTVSQPMDSILSDAKTAPISPHIKHSIISGNLKISCVSWFAEDFAKLREKWNIDADFIKSMTRCKTWNMMGGKSKSGFFVTLDGQWIAKQLLNVWSVDEKEAFLEFAPAYLRYMMNSTQNDCPTLLVKIAGVYSIKFKDIKTGEVKLKISVQVLENVFAGDDGESIRFDIKGIRDRRIPLKKDSNNQEEEERAPVWWDGEWLDTFQSRAYVTQAHKALFQRALSNDLAFLTASNVMDYSLLIGAHEANERDNDDTSSNQTKMRPTFRVRIVDFLGAFTLAKYIESSSKKAIKSQAPTIIPPHDYAVRFTQAVESYFIPCPS